MSEEVDNEEVSNESVPIEKHEQSEAEASEPETEQNAPEETTESETPAEEESEGSKTEQSVPEETTETEEASKEPVVEIDEESADKVEEDKPEEIQGEVETATETEEKKSHIFALRTTANREDQVVDFLTSHINKKGLNVYAIIRPHGMRGYIFLEAPTRTDAEQSCFNVPYARGILPNEIQYSEIEHMLEQVKQVMNIQKGDIVELISGPFKREKAKISRIDQGKEEVVVELLEAAVPIPITVKMDAVKVIRRETRDDDDGE
jgi:transcription termination/antitermination protein NusG